VKLASKIVKNERAKKGEKIKSEKRNRKKLLKINSKRERTRKGGENWREKKKEAIIRS
jgi:hypothetical protein